jgi:cobalt-zinc-cadmium efflux system membrane fusion protein
MWAEIDVPEDVLVRVAAGQRATIRVDVLGDRTFTGEVASLAPEIDPHTRTAVARVPLPNADGALRANMFADGQIAVDAPAGAVTVPREALQRAGEVHLVFVALGRQSYEARRVRIGVTGDAHVEILEGIRAGEPVVTEGSFLLKTETLRGSIGAGCCDVEPRGGDGAATAE